MNAFEAVWRNPYVRVAVYLGLIAVAYLLVVRLEAVVRLFLLSYLFAYLGNPFVTALERRGARRWIGTTLAFLILLVFLTLASVLIGTLVSQIVEFTKQLPQLVTRLQATLTAYVAGLEGRPELKSLLDQATKAVQDGLDNVFSNVLRILQGAGLNLVTRTFGVLSSVLEVFVVFVVGGYMLYSFPTIGHALLEVLPRAWQARAESLAADVSVAVGGYIRGQLLIAVSIGLMVGLGLTIVGEPLAPTIGFLAGVFNIVPYLGTVIAITPAILLAIPLGLAKVLFVILVFTVANQIEAHVLSPQILARSTELPPVTIILAILTGLALGGLAGGILAVPVAALLRLWIRKYWIGSSLHDGPPDVRDAPKLEEKA